MIGRTLLTVMLLIVFCWLTSIECKKRHRNHNATVIAETDADKDRRELILKRAHFLHQTHHRTISTTEAPNETEPFTDTEVSTDPEQTETTTTTIEKVTSEPSKIKKKLHNRRSKEHPNTSAKNIRTKKNFKHKNHRNLTLISNETMSSAQNETINTTISTTTKISNWLVYCCF